MTALSTQLIAATTLYVASVNCYVPSVTVKNGTISGIQIPSYNQEAFLGIPFAQAPIGDLRLAPPKPLETAWDGILNATQYYPRCAGYGGEQNGQKQSEDCLALNVVRPVGYENESLPVGLWIYGGGWSQGGTIDTLYNLSYIIQNSVEIGKPIMGVSIAYRLNGFGWMDSKEIRAAGATNLGLRDQRLALHWVRENIAAFGGKPEKVTIWGESAGAFSVAQHLIAYGGRDDKLFSGAILQSGHPLGTSTNANKTAEQVKYDNIVKDSACDTATDTLQCLRGLTYDEINNALNVTAQYTFSPYVDGDLIQGSVYDQLEKGEFVKVPILVGANSDDSLATNVVNTDQEFRKLLIARGSSDNQTISMLEVLYPNIPGYLNPETITAPVDPARGLQYKRVKTFDADFTFIAGRRIMSQIWSHFNQTVYSYRFNVLAAPELIPATAGATHWVEVAYVFDNPIRLNLGFPGKTPEGNQRLAKLISRMWASFVHTGDPNGHNQKGYPEWPIYRDGWGGYGQNYVFDANVTSYVEHDSFRGPAIAYLSKVFRTVYGK